MSVKQEACHTVHAHPIKCWLGLLQWLMSNNGSGRLCLQIIMDQSLEVLLTSHRWSLCKARLASLASNCLLHMLQGEWHLCEKGKICLCILGIKVKALFRFLPPHYFVLSTNFGCVVPPNYVTLNTCQNLRKTIYQIIDIFFISDNYITFGDRL